MRTILDALGFFVLLGSAALAQTANDPSNFSTKMELSGTPAQLKVPLVINLDEFTNDIPTNQLSKLAQNPISENAGASRSAKDTQIYRMASPSVVLVLNKEGIGSGSLVSSAGDILTNWHVVKGYSYVAIVFKPAVEGKEPT
jgi:S1-C subfamily serine protease